MKNLAFILPLLFIPLYTHASCGVIPNGHIATSTVFYSTNVDRCEAGQKPLSYNDILAQVAQEKAQDMAQHNYFSHQDLQGQFIWPSLYRHGYPLMHAGENLALNFTNIADLSSAWKNSPIHQANIVNNQYQEVGVGISGSYVVVVFGSR